jgi:hypothetical protein
MIREQQIIADKRKKQEEEDAAREAVVSDHGLTLEHSRYL